MYGLQHGALAHNEQQAIKGPEIISVKPFKRRICICILQILLRCTTMT